MVLVTLNFFFFFFFRQVLKTGLELMNLLPQHPECWAYRCEPPCLAFLITFKIIVLAEINL
jgi:hypothetical protein